MPVRCAIYARYSSDQQRPESIGDQVRHCRQEAARHQDWRVLDDHVYADEAVSGSSVEGRAGLARLVQAALPSPPPFDLILVDDTSRLARDVVDAVQHFRELRFRGVDLYFVNQGLHSGRDNAEFLLAIYGAMDSEYIRELGRKTHRGLEGQVRQGLSAGGIAYGYRREPIHDASRPDRDGQLRRIGVRWVVEPPEASTVRTIFEQYADGHGMATISAGLNAQGRPSPRQSKGHRSRRDSAGAGWDVSTVRVILGNDLYRGRLVWNRSRWVRLPGTRKRRRVARPADEQVVTDRPDLRIIDEDLWNRVAAQRAKVRAYYERPAEFGKCRAAYGTYLLSGRLVCAACGGMLTIRTGRPQRYGCTRHWRRGASACANNMLVRRDLAEARVMELLNAHLYTPEAVARLVDAVNARLKDREPSMTAEGDRVRSELQNVERRLDGLRQFVERGDTSTKVRQWLGNAEQDEGRLREQLQRIETQASRPALRVQPATVEAYLRDLQATLAKGGQRARQTLQEDIERIVIHPVRSDAAKPFARAEVITTGKGLLDRVAFVVAGARSGWCESKPFTFRFQVSRTDARIRH